jgi:diguanylate cyclase (GGDEF)-like protein/PAS domain S-box-containing protein
VQQNSWRRYLVVLTCLSVIGVALGETISGVANILTAVAGCVVIRRSIRAWQPEDRVPWTAAAVGTGLFACGGVVRGIAGDTNGLITTVADACDLSAYFALVVMVARLVRRRSHDRDPTNLLDAAIGVTGFCTLVWAVIVVPYLTDPRVTVHERIVESVFLATALILSTTLARLAIGPGAKTPSYYLLAPGAAGAVLLEIIISLQLSHKGAAASLDVVPLVIGSLSVICLGAGAMHPSMVELTKTADEPVAVMSAARLALLLAALTAPGAILITHVHDADRLFTLPILGAWMAIGIMVVWRMSGLLRARERAGTIDFIISRTAAGLVAATERSELEATAASGILQITEANKGTSVLVLDGLTVRRFDLHTGSAAKTSGRTEAIDLELAAAISGREPVHFFNMKLPDGSNAHSVLVVPLVSRDHRHGTVIVAEESRMIPHQQRDAIINITADLALALETATIEEAMHRARSERRFRSLVENAAEVIAVVDDTQQITFVSPAVSSVLGYTENDLLGTDFSALVCPAHRATVAGVMQPGEHATSEVELTHADGTPRWFDLVVGDLRAEPEIRGFVVTAREITERKTAALVLERREARFRALVQNAADGIALVGENGIISWVTPTLMRMLGLGPEALVDHRVEDVLVDEDREPYGDLERRARGSSGAPVTAELRFRTSDRAQSIIELTLTDQRREPAVGAFVANFHDITARKQLEDDLRHQALHDSLTGLPNRTLFHDRVAQALRKRNERDVAVLLIDLDDFQTINDAVGHSVGDDILKVVARRIEQFLRDGDTVARLGGDEFVIVLEGSNDRDAAYAVGNRILDELAAPGNWTGIDINLGASIGIVFASDCDDATPEIMLRNADMALYAAKRNGKGCIATFTGEMHTQVAERLSLKADLEYAVSLGQLELHYQPIVDLRDRSIRGFEALMRWNHPSRGLVSPAVFIPIAEETGAIIGMGRWLMDTAFAQLKHWNDDRPGLRPLRMSVNLSPRQLEDPTVAADVHAAIERYALESKLVTIEITESSAIEKDTVRHNRINEIAALGVGIAADDFGSGYASYAALSHLPFTGVKIDRSLVNGLTGNTNDRTTAQVQAILSMAELTGLSVVAEGIETEEQFEELRALGCLLGQGFLMYRPVPVSKATDLVTPPTVVTS